MRDVRYPEKPHINYSSNGETEIAYNGIKLHFRTSAKGNPICEKVEKIDRNLEGRIVTEFLGQTQEDWRDTNDDFNMNIPREKEHLLNLIEDLAYWYDEPSFAVLEKLLDTKLRGSPQYQSETYRLPQNMPNQKTDNIRRKQFRDVWAVVFRDNCTPAQAAQKLGYNPDEFRD